MGVAYPEDVTRFPPDILELMEKFNISEACFLPPPISIKLILQLTWLDIGVFAALTAMTVLTIAIYLENACYLMDKVKCPIKSKTLVWNSAAPTVIAITSCLGLWVPRAVMFVDMVAATYFGVGFYLMLLIIVQGYGGEEAMLQHLATHTIRISTGPCCCCCPCLPHIHLTRSVKTYPSRFRDSFFPAVIRQKFKIFVLGAFQVAFLRPALFLLGLVLWTNGLYDPDDWSSTSIFLWLNLFLGVSTILGLWPVNILFRHSKVLMADQKLTCKFALFQAILILSSLQNSIIGSLAGAGHIGCAPPYSARTRGQQMNNQLLIIEMFFVGVLTQISYRKRDDRPGHRPVGEVQQIDRECEQPVIADQQADHSSVSHI